MAEWPTVAALKRALGVDTDTRDADLAAALAAAIEQVGWDLGYLQVEITEESGDDAFTLTGTADADETVAEIVPNYSTAQAALILAVMAMKAPDAPFGIAAVFDTGGIRVAAEHPTYLRMLVGNRVSFGVG